MQKRLRITKFTDAAALFTLIFILFFQWSRMRGVSFYISVALGILLCVMLHYSVRLFRKHQLKSADKKNNMQHILYALTMLPEEKAMLYASCALADRYHLILPCRDMYSGYLPAYDRRGQKLAIGLHNDPTPVEVSQVHALHKLRSTMPAVLIFTSSPTDAALSYAQTLSPPLRLINATELPLDTSLADRFSAPVNKHKKRTAVSLLKAGPAQAVRCMLFSFGMMVTYLISGRLSILIPALLLVFIALLSKTYRQQETLF